MKRIFLITVVAVLSGAGLQARDYGQADAMWDRANTLYHNGDYAGAIAVYESIIETGYVSSKLYYNLGNAYFKDNSIGKAIVNYNRAQRMAPSDEDIKYNLAVANSYIKDRVDDVPEFFLSSWTKKLRVSLSSNVWAVISLAVLACALGCVLVYMLSQKKGLRKAGFFMTIVFAVLFVMSITFSVKEKRKLVNASEAIVVASAVSVRSSPDGSSKELFIIHEGTKVDVLGRFGSWTEIMIPYGDKGWLLEGSIELID